MNYQIATTMAGAWTRSNADSVKAAGGKATLWEGIVRPAAVNTERFAEHVRAVLGAGVEGVTIFEYNYLSDEDLAALKKL